MESYGQQGVINSCKVKQIPPVNVYKLSSGTDHTGFKTAYMVWATSVLFENSRMVRL